MKNINKITTENKIVDKIYKLKKLPFGQTSIECEFDSIKYQLLLVTYDRIKDKEIVRLMAKWRKKHEFWFQAQFKVTQKRTKDWLEKRVLDVPDRLLFMIKINDKYIGHFGFFRFDFKKSVCEIDNVVRGENTYPGMIGNGLMHLMKWGKNNLYIKNYTLETVSDNERAIKLYNRLGFIEYKRVPMIYVKRKDFNEWVVAPKGYKKKILRYNVYMKIKN